MRRIMAMSAALILSLPVSARAAEAERPPATEKVPETPDPQEAPKVELKTFAEKLSYVLGLSTGARLRLLETEIDVAALTRGIEDGLKGRKPALTEQEATAVLREATLKKQKEMAGKNLKAAEAFLAKNKKGKGVVTTESGLQYLVLKEGDGPKPTPENQVSVHYRGTLLDGTQFDSSYDRDKPAKVPVKGVIPGWTEALQLFKVGGKYRVFIPPGLAYGEEGAGRRIGPNALLIFEIELVKIVK